MKLYINAHRTGYAPDQIRHTMTVAELIAALEDFPEDAPVYLEFHLVPAARDVRGAGDDFVGVCAPQKDA